MPNSRSSHHSMRAGRALAAFVFISSVWAPTSQYAVAQSKPEPTNSSSGTSGKATDSGLALPIEHHTGDLDEMVKRRTIRALVVMDPISFFYDDGKPKGIMYEALDAFQQFANQKLKTGALKIEVDYVPRTLEQLESTLEEGIGDFIAYGVVVTPERREKVAFSTPIQRNATNVIVTGKQYAGISTFDDLAGKDVLVSPVTVDGENLRKINEDLAQSGKPPIRVRYADGNLTDSDLLQMVSAGLIPATVTLLERAVLWSQVLPGITIHPDLVTSGNQELSWVMRKNNPKLKALVDEFVATRMAGTSFGNTLLRRYMQNPQWVKSATSEQEMKKFNELVAVFKKYGQRYDFDYLMLVAQGYQESQLQQNRRSPGGTVGIMQVNPKIAAAPPISVPDVNVVDGNIEAAAKMLRQISDDYFNDPAIDPLNRTLFVFASYNAGPNRIKRLREVTRQNGLNPNVWFGNVELVVAKEIGQVTVSYVSNIYKYYVAYKLASEQSQLN